MSPALLRRPRAIAALGALSLACGSVLLVATPASAVDLGPASTETQFLTLLATANGDATPDEITLEGSGFTLTGDLPAITQPLTITGPGSGAFTLDAAGFDAFDLASSAASVTIAGVTVTGAGTASSTYGIHSDHVALALDDVIVTESYGGLQASGGAVTATDSSFTKNDQFGAYLEFDSAPGGSLGNVDLSDNGWSGLYAYVTLSGSLAVTGSTADGNDGEGFDIDAYDDTSVTVTGSSADSNSNNGFNINARNNASMTFTATQADLNFDSGIDLSVEDSATATFTATTVTNTDADDGIHVEANGSSVVSFTDTTASDNDSDGIEASIFDDAVFTMTRSTIDGSGADGADLYASNGGTIIVDDLAVDDSDDNGLEFEADTSGSITLSHATVTNSHEGVGAELVAHDSGLIDITTSTISDNDNQGVWISSGEDDASDAVVTITDTTVKDNGNDEVNGGGILITDQNGLTVNVVNSTISGNTAAFGGGIYVGPLDSEGEGEEEGGEPTALHLTVINSTVSGNVGNIVGGVYVSGFGMSEDSTVSILNSTITDNTVEEDGPAGVAVLGEYTAVISNSIIADNVDLPGLYGDLDIDLDLSLDITYSLVGDPSTNAAPAVSAGTGNITGVDPKLGPLADNGGSTFTHLPLDGSPAINAGEPGFSGLTADQRGLTRVVGTVDMGAVEVQPALAVTGMDATVPLTGGILIIGAGFLLVAMRRRLAAR